MKLRVQLITVGKGICLVCTEGAYSFSFFLNDASQFCEVRFLPTFSWAVGCLCYSKLIAPEGGSLALAT